MVPQPLEDDHDDLDRLAHRGDRPHDAADEPTAYAWYSILKFAYPERTKWKDILAGYAVSVALNGILPANLGTLVFLIMLTGFPP